MEKLSALIEEVPARVRATAKSRVPARDPTGPLSVRRQVQAINPLPNRPSPSQADRLPEGTEGSLIGQVKRIRGIAANLSKISSRPDLLIIRVHCPVRQQWFLLGADFASRALLCFDSRYDNDKTNSSLSILRDFCVRVVPGSLWYIHAVKVPQQVNEQDCGAFTLMYAEALFRRAPVETSNGGAEFENFD
ncbi:unnamed protein product [Bemisia tabaci]|uniref:Ubiquitin-like protease family profile domain-containing protein n=1 Tax=Bemisia tabaci TaxID=7038 RepID=A0A9P0A2D6_BEMTA|nr:unnamed protein product [Bemisia tabaci]